MAVLHFFSKFPSNLYSILYASNVLRDLRSQIDQLNIIFAFVLLHSFIFLADSVCQCNTRNRNLKSTHWHSRTLYLPITGGPITEAIPWKNRISPNELVSLSRPRRSVRTTLVNPTYAPLVTPNTAQYIAYTQIVDITLISRKLWNWKTTFRLMLWL